MRIYTNTTGIMTVTTSTAHGLSTTGKSSDVLLTGLLGFTCALDNGGALHYYPRANSVTNPHGGDPIYCGTPCHWGYKRNSIYNKRKYRYINSSNNCRYVSGFWWSAQPVLIAPRANNNSPSGQDVGFDGSTVLRVLMQLNLKSILVYQQDHIIMQEVVK